MGTKPQLESISATYWQDEDTCGSGKDQHITISTEPCDTPGNWYYVIETGRWAINDIGELVELLSKFISKVTEDKQI